MKSHYLFYFCDGIGSVFDSQVLALLNAINDKNVFKKIYLFLGIKDENQRVDFLKNKLTFEINIVFFTSYPNYPFFNYFIRKSIKDALLSQNIVLEKVIFHTRGELTALYLSKILDKKYHKSILPDVRGASVEEIEEFYNLNKIQKSVKTFNNKLSLKKLNKFSKISVVSSSLKDYLINNYKINAEKIFITPSLAGKDFTFNEQQREKIREDFNLNEDDILIVFSSGGTAGWQNNEPLTWLADKGFKVLNLSKKEILHNNIINRFISYDEMPAYLGAADIAIIWRNKSNVNKVASPVKFSEYICSGLPVIANNSVDMISVYIKEYNCGLLIDSFDDIEERTLKELKQKDRKKNSEEGIINFGVGNIVDKYFQIYSSMKSL